jgi:hypothetical protein
VIQGTWIPSTRAEYTIQLLAAEGDRDWFVGRDTFPRTAPESSCGALPTVKALGAHHRSEVPASPTGSASVALYGISGNAERLWAVGEIVDAVSGGSPLIDNFHDGRWITLDSPSVGSRWSTLWGVSVGRDDDSVWAVGNLFNVAKGDDDTLVLRGHEDHFQVVNAPNPGAGVNILASVATDGKTAWSVGHFKDNSPRQTLIEQRQQP